MIQACEPIRHDGRNNPDRRSQSDRHQHHQEGDLGWTLGLGELHKKGFSSDDARSQSLVGIQFLQSVCVVMIHQRLHGRILGRHRFEYSVFGLFERMAAIDMTDKMNYDSIHPMNVHRRTQQNMDDSVGLLAILLVVFRCLVDHMRTTWKTV